MKIMHIDTENTWRGGENQLRYLIEGGLKAGFDMGLVAREGSEIYRRLSPAVKTLALPLKGELDFLSARKLAVYCLSEGVDILDAHTAHAHSLAMLAKLFYPNLKIVVHRRVDFIPKGHFFNRLKYLHRSIDRYVAISQAIAKVLVEFGVDKSKVAVVPSAVDPRPHSMFLHDVERAKLLTKHKVSFDTPIIGTAAALTPQKDYPTLIKALGILKQSGTKFHCFIAGDGSDRQTLQELVASLQLDGEVTFLGWLQEMEAFFAAIDMFALSSKKEGLGTVIQEATYAGCPVLACAVGGVPEMIAHKHSGWLSSAEDVQVFAENLQDAISHPDLRTVYAAQAKMHITANFGLQNMVEKNLMVYQQLV